MLTEAKELATQLNVPEVVALDVLYLRTRNRWTQELEDQLLHIWRTSGKRVNVYEFGVTKETGQALLDEALMEIKRRGIAARGAQ